MDNDITEFTYDLSKISIRPSDDFVAVVPLGLDTKEKLFDALGKELNFPSYFGRNWDALLDCLRDFSWIEKRRIIIIHRDIPPLSEKPLLLYLDTLTARGKSRFSRLAPLANPMAWR